MNEKPISAKERFETWKGEIETRALQHEPTTRKADKLLAALFAGFLIYRAIEAL